jgi:hypothetical protein
MLHELIILEEFRPDVPVPLVKQKYQQAAHLKHRVTRINIKMHENLAIKDVQADNSSCHVIKVLNGARSSPMVAPVGTLQWATKL